MKCMVTEYIRGSVQVKLVAVLDVEHEIPSIQILHNKEQVFLHMKKQSFRAVVG